MPKRILSLKEPNDSNGIVMDIRRVDYRLGDV